MLLYSSRRSPYVRKVLVCAHETGLIGQIAEVPKVVSYLAADEEVGRHNPLGQIPTLVLDDGSVLYDSGVICAYFAELRPEAGLEPAAPAARLAMRRRQAEGDGLMMTFLRWYGERRRADHPLSPQYVAVCRGTFRRMLEHWEGEAARWQDLPLDIGFVAIGCALAYADFRFEAEAWRPGRPVLAAWYARLCARPSFAATAFDGGG